MHYVKVHDVNVPALGFGTWELRGDACRESVRDALEIGYRHIDTAQMYENEKEVGEGISQFEVPRHQLFVTTKLHMDNVAPKRVLDSTRESLDKLQMDYVDLLLIHWPSDEVPAAETLGAMKELQDAGQVRHLGVSNFTPSLVDEAAKHAKIFCNQVEYHPLLNQNKLLEQARSMDYLLTAYCPLARGEAFDHEPIRQAAEAHGKSPAQVILRWLIQQDHVAAIPKSADPHHRRGNFDIFDFELDDAQVQAIDALAGNNRLIDPDWAPAWER